MKSLFFIAFVLLSTAASGQGFKFKYFDQGLGSSRGDPPHLLLSIDDTAMTYTAMEWSSEFNVDSVYQDTVWVVKPFTYNVHFRPQSRDSILYILKGMEGKYIFRSNPLVMSGAIQHMYIEYQDWCVEFCLKNTFDSTALQIANIINAYLHKPGTIYTNDELWKMGGNDALIKDCEGSTNTNYTDILGDEYDLLRQQGEKKK